MYNLYLFFLFVSTGAYQSRNTQANPSPAAPSPPFPHHSPEAFPNCTSHAVFTYSYKVLLPKHSKHIWPAAQRALWGWGASPVSCAWWRQWLHSPAGVKQALSCSHMSRGGSSTQPLLSWDNPIRFSVPWTMPSLQIAQSWKSEHNFYCVEPLAIDPSGNFQGILKITGMFWVPDK